MSVSQMNTDQLAEIRPALREVFNAPPNVCLTLEVAGNGDNWVQIVDRTLNAAYPHTDEPASRLKGPNLSQHGLELESWEAEKFATFEVKDIELEVLAAWIDAYIVQVLECADGQYHLDVAFQEL